MRSIRLSHGRQTVVVEIITAESVGAFGGRRRWFRCPRCCGKTSVVGFDFDGAGCKKCIGWRPRRKMQVDGVVAPHLRDVVAAPNE
jgi:hypothetical protein